MKDLKPLNKWIPDLNNSPLLIAGPCSAESYEQLYEIAKDLKEKTSIHFLRAGVWKPRTRPGQFEGNGEQALLWLNKLRKELNIKVCIEVANPKQAELALKYEIDLLWFGARTTVNPFLVQEIADALKGTDIPVFVKNPVSPDLNLWVGSIERVLHSGIKKVAAIHRGFTTLDNSIFRNNPLWSIPLELKSKFPSLPVICDPSHIAGKRDFIGELCQKAMDLSFDGLMVEVHNNPNVALSDKEQQILPSEYEEIIKNLKIPTQSSLDKTSQERLTEYREMIDYLDNQLLETLASRMKIVKKIGALKKSHNLALVQMDRWNKLLEDKLLKANKVGLREEFIKNLFLSLHAESLELQSDLE